jgi:TonB family protein
MVLELNRAVAVLNQGIAAHWGDRNRYLSAFVKTPDVDMAGRPVTDSKSYVTCLIDRHFRNHEVWDEGVPIDAEARLTVIELTKLSESKQTSDLPPCVSSEHRKIVLSAGVAAALLKIKIDPIYPADARQHNVSGAVTLRATIDTDGHVKTLTIVSGPDELRQAALDAVSQWAYTPYQLGGRPVEVETTISVPFDLHR